MSVVFRNNGVIDIKFITTFGVSAKEGTNPIGFFGTGLKYAIAVLLREKQNITIMAGESILTFRTETDSLRGKDFEFIHMDIRSDSHPDHTVQLPFTTELGKNWKIWQAFRELYCNCVDEGGQSYLNVNTLPAPEQLKNNVISMFGGDDVQMVESRPEIVPNPGQTIIIVNGKEFRHAWEHKDEIILNKRNPIAFDRNIEVFSDRNVYAFVKTIRAHEFQAVSMFTWNVKTNIELTEDRTIKHTHYLQYYMQQIVAESDNKQFIEQMVLAPKGTVENGLTYSSYPSKTFLDVVGNLRLQKLMDINPSAVRLYEEHRDKLISSNDKVELTPLQQQVLTKAIGFCVKQLHCTNLNKFPITVVDMSNNVLGLARNDEIFLNQRVFKLGTKQVVATLYEEYLHCHNKLDDCDREMQNYLMETIVDLAEQIEGSPL